MAKPREKLGDLLEDILGEHKGNCYFEPPDGMEMNYPCIIYELSNALVQHADNFPYLIDKRYILTVIDRDPDSEIRDRVLELPKCSFDRAFTSDNLNHYVFTLYF